MKRNSPAEWRKNIYETLWPQLLTHRGVKSLTSAKVIKTCVRLRHSGGCCLTTLYSSGQPGLYSSIWDKPFEDKELQRKKVTPKMLLSVFLGALTSVTGILRMVSGWNDISFDARLCGLRKDITGVWEFKLSYPVWRKLVKKGTNISPLEPLAENQTVKRETSRGEVTLDAWDPGKFRGAAADRERKPVLFGTFCISKKHSTLSEKWYDFPPRLKNATPYAKC